MTMLHLIELCLAPSMIALALLLVKPRMVDLSDYS
jgi:hypothetical protein